MANTAAEILRSTLSTAATEVFVGSQYFHYKHPELLYTVTGLAVVEATDGVGVLYRADYESLNGIVFFRPIESFLGEVGVAGKNVKRFSLVR